jgi:hypothetical protein
MQLQFTAESELVLRLFSDIMPCSVAGENIIKTIMVTTSKLSTHCGVSLDTSAGIQ